MRQGVIMENRELIAEAAESSGLPVETVNQIIDGLTAKFEGVARSNNPSAVAAIEGAEILTASGTVVAKRATGALGTSFVDSAQYAGRTGVHSGPVEVAALLSRDASSGGDLLVPEYRPGVMPILFRRLTIADLMPNTTTAASSITYFEESTATNAAAETTEGSAKPESTLAFNQVNEPVQKIATILPVTDEMLEDAPTLEGYINARLRLFIELREDQQLYNGNGTAPNISGILDRANVQTQAVGSETYFKNAIGVFKAGTKVRSNIANGAGLEPDGLVISPNDWQKARLEADANGQFAGGGPFTGPYGQNGVVDTPYWGMRVVVTPAATDGTALVGAFAQAAQVFRRSGITVESTVSHDDWFAYNKTAIRAEERLALAVYRAAAFCTVTGIA